MRFGSQTIDDGVRGLLILLSSAVLLTAVLDPDIIVAIERSGSRELTLVGIVGEEGCLALLSFENATLATAFEKGTPFYRQRQYWSGDLEQKYSTRKIASRMHALTSP